MNVLLRHQSHCLLLWLFTNLRASLFQSIASHPLKCQNCWRACSPPRLSVVSVVLTFNASLNAHAPSAPTVLAGLCLIVSIHPQQFALFLSLHTCNIECCQRCVDLQCITQCSCSFCANAALCFVFVEQGCVIVSTITANQFDSHVGSSNNLNVFNALFVFNASLNATAPLAFM